jgi:hypothetical protein
MRFIFEDVEEMLNFTNCKDVNPSGIGRFGVSPLLNASFMYYVDSGAKRDYTFHDVREDIEGYIITVGVNHSPEDWTGYEPKVKSLFYYLNEKYLRDLRNNVAILLIDQSFEGYQTPWLWDWFHNECKEWGINPKNIIYITGNMVSDEFYEKWANENNIEDRMFVKGYAHFELDLAVTNYHKLRTEENQLPTFQDHIKYKTENLSNIKTFACLNKRFRPHRIWFFKYLYESGLLDKGMVSMNVFDTSSWWFEGRDIELETVEKIKSVLPLRVYNLPNDELGDNHYIRRFNDKICLDTFVTVISEAQCGDSQETMFISEKTYKVIACRQPFIIMGNKDTLKKLRETGYKTFDGFIDESYDSLPTFERMEAIIESLKKINSIEDKLTWFKGMEEIIEHNYNTFMGKLTKKIVEYVEVENHYNNLFTHLNLKKNSFSMKERKYLPTLAELVDRLSISQLKEVFITEHRDEYSQEIQDIQHDIQLLLEEKNINIPAEVIRAIVVLSQTNLHIWHNESNYRRGIKEGNNLELTHGLNGVRNTAKNKIQEVVGGRKDYKLDCLAAEFQNWGISW